MLDLTMLAPWRVHAAVGVVVLAWACACTTHPEHDAGRDASAPADTAAVDVESPTDSPSDTTVDAPDVEVPGFVRVGTDVLPADCDLRMATDPMATHGGPLSFVPCPSRSGCRQVDVDWTTPANPTFEVGHFASEHDGEVGRFAYTRLAPDSPSDRFIDWGVVARDDGVIDLILRSPRLRCQALWPAIHDGRFATIVYYRRSDAQRIGEYIVGGELDDPLGTFTVLAFVDSTIAPEYPQTIVVDRTGVAAELSGAATILRITWDGDVSVVASPATTGVGTSSLDYIQDGHVVFTAVGAPAVEVRSVAPDASTTVLRGLSDSGHPGLARTDGVHMAWMTGSDRTGPLRFDDMDLWVSASCVTPPCEDGLRLGDVPEARSFRPLVVGHGLIALPTSDTQIRFYDVDGSVIRDIDLPEGGRWQAYPPYIGPTEIPLVPAIDRFPSSPPEAETVMFVRRDSL